MRSKSHQCGTSTKLFQISDTLIVTTQDVYRYNIPLWNFITWSLFPFTVNKVNREFPYVQPLLPLRASFLHTHIPFGS